MIRFVRQRPVEIVQPWPRHLHEGKKKKREAQLHVVVGGDGSSTQYACTHTQGLKRPK